MVRLKHRYLLVNFLYPSPSITPSKPATALPDAVQFHQPSSDKLTAGFLLKIIREGVADLFGDYGAGMTGSTLAGKSAKHVMSCPCASNSLRHQSNTSPLQRPQPYYASHATITASSGLRYPSSRASHTPSAKTVSFRSFACRAPFARQKRKPSARQSRPSCKPGALQETTLSQPMRC